MRIPHHKIISAVGKYHLSTATQLARHCFSLSSRGHTKNFLTELYRQGYLGREEIPTKGGPGPFYYFLASKGRKYLDSIDVKYQVASRPSNELDHKPLFVDHTLATNDILMSAERLGKAHPDVYAQEIVHDFELKKSPVWVTVSHDDKRQRVFWCPDGYIQFRAPDDPTKPDEPQYLCVLVECDRSTEEHKKIAKKVLSYWSYWKSGEYRARFRTESMNVALVAPGDERRRDVLRHWTDLALQEFAGNQADLAAIQNIFWITSADAAELTPLEFWQGTHWYRPFDSQPHPFLPTGGTE